MSRLLALLTAALVALVFAACGDDSSSESEATPEPTATEEAATTPAAANEFLPEGCENVEAPAPKEDGTLKAPTEKLDESKTYVATMSTTCGDIQITLDAKDNPITAGSFKYLADQKFYDGLTFHRIVADFVIQGGDPLGQGTGGAGYSVEEAPPSDYKYAPGDLAMAKTGDEPAGTSGSQFFIVTSENGAAQLTPDYAVAGKVTEGMDVVEKIGGIQADPNTGMPAAQVIIKSVTVEEK
ncbi:peptidylprolyl isomerase [Solirubrobacter phytolaccae]|uniref:Peptidyl-prolyl cis-trans isomerase n=1 Tax=Solirubrobacter phytolaccae TaxID=1404360 RepID=A0A9X3N987_9ACTN|nr:peptidylprolyl isomerase [Solirubrobacter phytolaccae]MDA0182128.1 peptidylprolyl isomerase [Solirubrobacter phytolaccae]